MNQHLDEAERRLAAYAADDRPWDGGLALLLAGCLARQEICGRLLERFLPAAMGWENHGPETCCGVGNLLLWAGETRGDHSAIAQAERLHGQLTGSWPGIASGDAWIAVFPFYAAYETRYNEKRGYNDLFARLREEAARELDGPLPDAERLTALLLVWENADEELFEHYKTAQRLFKDALKALLERRSADGAGMDLTPTGTAEYAADALLAFCILRGVRLGALLGDRYLPIARRLLRELSRDLADSRENRLHDAASLGAALLLGAELPQQTERGEEF